MSLLEFC